MPQPIKTTVYVTRVRPEEPFRNPDDQGWPWKVYLSRPLVLRPDCIGTAISNTIFTHKLVSYDMSMCVLPVSNLMRLKHVYAMPIVYKWGEEVILRLHNYDKEHTATLESGTELAEVSISGPFERHTMILKI